MTTVFELGYPDILAFMRHYVRTSREVRRARWIYGVLGPVVFAFMLFEGNAFSGPDFVGALTGFILLSAIYILVVNFSITRRVPARMAKKLVANPENANLIGHRKMTFTDEGIEVVIEKSDSRMTWDTIVKLGDTGTHFLLYIGANQAYIVPKQQIAPADVETLNGLLQAHHLL